MGGFWSEYYLWKQIVQWASQSILCEGEMSGIVEVLRKKKFFIWDFDGCLCDSERSHFLAYAKAFSNFGHQVDEASYYASFTHLGNGTEREIRQYQLPCAPAQIASLKNIAYREIIGRNEIPLFPEIPKIVSVLRGSGAKVAIASNSPTEELFAILDNNELRSSFDLIVGRTPDLRKKPFPDLFLHALSTLGARPEDALVFEDADKGLEAAQRAGCDCVWVKTRFNEGLSSLFPRIAEISHNDLLDAVQRAFPDVET
jgi:HAD superfamily hydrolase (TIGR01509 family)